MWNSVSYRLGLFEAGLLDLVQQGLVADAEQLSRFAPIPVHLAQSIGNDRSLSR